MNKRQLRSTYRKYLFSYTFEALPMLEPDEPQMARSALPQIKHVELPPKPDPLTDQVQYALRTY